MRIALVQVASPPGESVSMRRSRVGRMVLAAGGAQLVVLPELWVSGYFAFDRYVDDAETLGGATVALASEWARRLQAHVHLGSLVLREADGRLSNMAVLLDPSGSIVHTYRKAHVFGCGSQEATLLAPGDDISVVPTPFGAVAGTTCYDLRFPEMWRQLVDAGAEVVIVPAAWPAARRPHWRVLTTCRALEEQVLLVACNAVGEQAGVVLGGASRVVDPWGDVLVEAGDDEGITSVDVDPNVVGRVRREFPVLEDRRPPLAIVGGPQAAEPTTAAAFRPELVQRR